MFKTGVKFNLDAKDIEWATWIVGDTIFTGTRIKDTQRLHGLGRLVGIGEIIEGYWKHGRLNGYGRRVEHDGQFNEGQYADGVFKGR